MGLQSHQLDRTRKGKRRTGTHHDSLQLQTCDLHTQVQRFSGCPQKMETELQGNNLAFFQNAFDEGAGVRAKCGGVVFFGRFQKRDEMGFVFTKGGRRLRQERHALVNLHRIAGNHFDGKKLSDLPRNLRFSGGGGTHKDKQFFLQG